MVFGKYVIIFKYQNFRRCNTLSNIKKYWPVGLLIVCFMLCTVFNTQDAYALDAVTATNTATNPITITNNDINTEEKVSLEDIANSYKKLANKLKTNEKEKQESIEEYEKEIARKKAEEAEKKKNKLRQDIVKVALSKRGCNYVWGATGPSEFDCSGLTQWAYKQMGISIPRVAASQAQSGQKVNKSDLKIGDLIFFRTDKGSSRISHVGMYVGNGQMVHAPAPGYKVQKANIYSTYWTRAYAWSCRFI